MRTVACLVALLLTLRCAFAERDLHAQTTSGELEKSRLDAAQLRETQKATLQRKHEIRTGKNRPDEEGFTCFTIRRVGDEELIVDVAPVEVDEGQPPQLRARFFAVDFDLLVYGRNSSAKNARRLFLTRLDEKIEDIHRARPLTDLQRTKLKGAGRVDIARFFRRVEELRPTFDEVYVLNKDGRFQKLNELMLVEQWSARMIRPIHALHLELQANPFGEGSYFLKAFRKDVAEQREEQPDPVEFGN